MKFFAAALGLAATLVPQVTAHYRWTSLIVNGTTTSAYQYVKPNTNINSPVTVVSSNDMTCNAGASAAPGIAWAKAGSVIGFALDTPIFHPGPINVYMAKVPTGQTAATFTGTGKVWFKVAQLGATTDGGSTIKWPADNLSSFSFTIPSKLVSGDYLVRIEHIALHTASAYGEAQFYISCGQIHVFGTGTSSPSSSSLVAIPGVYTGNEPGLLINIWWPIPVTYTQPGPAVWS
ncbi:hypothetical protein M407DRAFT_27348 [Tulasnella calospora MUT 4182]|uniref:lytic cellulose monooxygenase (C4-dehydrogenating) n=1 Tax=Tulasnella calospora MUT 4182 TaxID=1051891 RepID=A0A0C3QBE1_9AGAM|nr:glycoside hydrolase family 61 protein [Tulasnella calospora MUT 4182]KIO23200.1 hypothetical protein M407DRAFT_27348 [Tulasnella calospora MUT 4182]